jgi:hypothetical protein
MDGTMTKKLQILAIKLLLIKSWNIQGTEISERSNDMLDVQGEDSWPER